MDEQYRGMPEMDWLWLELDNVLMRPSIERVGDDILVCDSLEESEVFDSFRFAREEEHDNAEPDVSKEMEILEKWYKKNKKK